MDTIGFLISNGRSAGTSTEILAKEIYLDYAFSAGYWSSTENSENNAWNVNFSNGNTNNNNKYNSNAVRAVAALGLEVKIGWLEAYHDCCSNKKSSFDCNRYRTQYELDLWLLIYEVYTKTYKPGPSTCFIVTFPKLREVFAAAFRDRIVHHWICLRLDPLFEARFNAQGNVSHNCRKGFGTRSAVSSFNRDVCLVTQHYTREAHIGRFDIKAFFMSISPRILWDLLRLFIIENYKGDDIDTLLYLTETVIMNRPQENCIKRSPEELFKALPPGKSLFNSETGVPIGNLPSQLFANFLLSFLDEAMVKLEKLIGPEDFRYERYVDDFTVVCVWQEVIVSLHPIIEQLLLGKMGLTLHPDKLYLQEAKKGAAFVGSVVKQGRVYLSNRTVHGLHKALDTLQDICLEIVEKGEDKYRLKLLEHTVSSVNSYLGFTVHCNAYNVRRKAFANIDPRCWQICYVKRGTLACVKIKKKYKLKNYLVSKEVKDYDLVLRQRKTRQHSKKNNAGANTAHG